MSDERIPLHTVTIRPVEEAGGWRVGAVHLRRGGEGLAREGACPGCCGGLCQDPAGRARIEGRLARLSADDFTAMGEGDRETWRGELARYGVALGHLLGAEDLTESSPNGDLEILLDLPRDPAFESPRWELLVLADGPACALRGSRPGTGRGRLRGVTRVGGPRGPAGSGAPEATWRRPEEPLVVLFVAGSDPGDRELRAAHEYLGMLAVHAEARARLLVRVGPGREELRRVVRRFRPHVVHLAGHGSGDGRVQIGPDPEDWCGVPELAGLLRGEDGLWPWLVVLNACGSAGAGALAERLVEAGVGAAVGMGDSVGDTAARAFGVGLYERLLAGEPLPTAVAGARDGLAAWGIEVGAHPDATRPVLVRQEQVELGAAALTSEQVAQGEAVGALVRSWRPRVFAGRREVLDRHLDWVLELGPTRVLLLEAAPGTGEEERVGLSRLLGVLGCGAAREGRVVLRVEPGPGGGTATEIVTFHGFVGRIREAVEQARTWWGLGEGPGLLDLLEIRVAGGGALQAGEEVPAPLARAVARERRWDRPEVLAVALRCELEALGRPALLVVDELSAFGEHGAQLVDRALRGALRPASQGLAAVVGTKAPPRDHPLAQPLREWPGSEVGGRFRHLGVGPLQEGSERAVALAQWLLDWRLDDDREFPVVPAEPGEAGEEILAILAKRFRGYPARVNTRAFRDCVQILLEAKRLRQARPGDRLVDGEGR